MRRLNFGPLKTTLPIKRIRRELEHPIYNEPAPLIGLSLGTPLQNGPCTLLTPDRKQGEYADPRTRLERFQKIIAHILVTDFQPKDGARCLVVFAAFEVLLEENSQFVIHIGSRDLHTVALPALRVNGSFSSHLSFHH